MARSRRQSVGGINTPRVVFVMNPDEQQLRHDLLLLSRKISDYNKPLLHSKEYIIEDTKKTFRLERDPETGNKWPALSPRAKRVPRYGMLQRLKTRRAMYRSVTAKNHYGISKEGVWFNQRTVPDYAGLHQQDERIPPKPITTQAIAVRSKEIFEQHKKDNLRTSGRDIVNLAKAALRAEAEQAAGEGKIPQRRFMGVSQFANAQIQRTFDDWASDAIIIYKRGGKHIKSKRPNL